MRLSVRAAVLALAASAGMAGCGAGRAFHATPTIEYITPTVATPTLVIPTETQRPTLTPTSTPEFKPAIIAAPTIQVSGQSLEKLTPVETVQAPTGTVQAGSGNGVTSTRAAAYEGQCGWGYSTNVTRWWPVITQYPWDACTVVYIISRESGGLNVYNFEGSGACGVMQLLPCRYPYDGAANIAYGYYHKYLLAGWSPWAVMG